MSGSTQTKGISRSDLVTYFQPIKRNIASAKRYLRWRIALLNYEAWSHEYGEGLNVNFASKFNFTHVKHDTHPSVSSGSSCIWLSKKKWVQSCKGVTQKLKSANIGPFQAWQHEHTLQYERDHKLDMSLHRSSIWLYPLDLLRPALTIFFLKQKKNIWII